MGNSVTITSTIAFALALGACASKPEDIATSYVSPLLYQQYNCDQMRMELARVSRRASELRGTLQKTAKDDQAQVAVSLIFWPSLFFLEGGDGVQAQEYARLKGERDALEQAAIGKNCSIEVKTTPPSSAPAGG